MNITNKHELPETFLKAVDFQDSTRKGIDLKLDHVSVTRLIEAPRIRMLTLLHWNELQEDVTDRLWSLFGQGIHAILAWGSDPETVITEQRLYANVKNNWKLSGQFDALDLNEKRIYDYKVTSVYGIANGVKPEWERQLNLLRLLAIHNGYEVDSLEVCVILRDWQSSQALRDSNYPPIPVLRLPVPVWPIEDTRGYLEERVRLHQEAAYGDTLPECSAEERWEKTTAYAVMKPTRKTAIRVFSNPREAEELAAKTDGAYVQVRPGEAIRCARYCAVAKFCDQYQRELAARRSVVTDIEEAQAA